MRRGERGRWRMEGRRWKMEGERWGWNFWYFGTRNIEQGTL
jgi:hypothetical protein